MKPANSGKRRVNAPKGSREKTANRKTAAEKTRRKKVKAEAKELRFKQTLGALPDGVVLLLKNWEIQWLNRIAQSELGLDPGTDVGKKIVEVYPDKKLTNYINKGEFSKSILLKNKAGQILETRIISAGAKFWALVTRDVTEHKRADAFRRDFIANVSHELRTPLTVLKGFVELFEEGAKTPQDKLHCQMMSEQVVRMSSIVDDLLTLGKLEQIVESAVRDRIDILQLLNDVADDGRALSQGKHNITVEGDPSIIILGDEGDIQSAVENLVSNAVKYTPEGGKIQISCVKDPEGAVVSVKDNGIGIAKTDIPRLTERFYRVDKSRSRATGGTGLGLAIVKHILFMHQSNLEINSELGKGSEFRIHIPKERVATKATEK